VTKHCGSEYDVVASLQTVVPVATIAALAPSTTEQVQVDHALGTFRVSGQVQLWGLHDLPDPAQTALPVDKMEAGEAPHAGRIFDMDEDANPGITTLVVSAEAEAQVYAIQRKVTDVDGVIVSPDVVVGHSENQIEILTLGASVTFFDIPGLQTDETERALSWFEEKRLDDGANCESVMNAVASGDLGAEQPF